MRKWVIYSNGKKIEGVGPYINQPQGVEVVTYERYKEVLYWANMLSDALNRIGGPNYKLENFNSLTQKQLVKIVREDTKTARQIVKSYVKWLEEQRKELENARTTNGQ